MASSHVEVLEWIMKYGCLTEEPEIIQAVRNILPDKVSEETTDAVKWAQAIHEVKRLRVCPEAELSSLLKHLPKLTDILSAGTRLSQDNAMFFDVYWEIACLAILHSSVITADPGSRGAREFDEFLENCDPSQSSSESQSQSQGDNSSAHSSQSSSSQTRGRRRKEASKSSQSKSEKAHVEASTEGSESPVFELSPPVASQSNFSPSCASPVGNRLRSQKKKRYREDRSLLLDAQRDHAKIRALKDGRFDRVAICDRFLEFIRSRKPSINMERPPSVQATAYQSHDDSQDRSAESNDAEEDKADEKDEEDDSSPPGMALSAADVATPVHAPTPRERPGSSSERRKTRKRAQDSEVETSRKRRRPVSKSPHLPTRKKSRKVSRHTSPPSRISPSSSNSRSTQRADKKKKKRKRNRSPSPLPPRSPSVRRPRTTPKQRTAPAPDSPLFRQSSRKNSTSPKQRRKATPDSPLFRESSRKKSSRDSHQQQRARTNASLLRRSPRGSKASGKRASTPERRPKATEQQQPEAPDSDSSSEGWASAKDIDDLLEQNRMLASSSPSRNRRRRRWTVEETEDLKIGIERHGNGNWAQIHRDPRLHFHKDRRPVDLKDKARNMRRAGMM